MYFKILSAVLNCLALSDITKQGNPLQLMNLLKQLIKESVDMFCTNCK